MEFSPGINVFIGKNGTGKTHILKLIYASLLALKEIEAQNIKYPEAKIQEKLVNCFMPDELQRLIRRGGDRGAAGNKTASVEIEISKKKLSYSFNRKNNKIENIKKPKLSIEDIIYLPPIEMLSIQKGFAAAWKNRENSFDETYYQLANLLDLNPARGPREANANKLLEAINDKLKASVTKKDNGKFYINIGGADLESALVGDKKLYLIEIKDPRTDESGNDSRKWDVEVAKKIKDTVSGIAGFSNTSGKLKKEFKDSLSCFLSNNFTIIFWLESSRIYPTEKNYAAVIRDRNSTGFGFIQNNLQKRLKRLTKNISIINAETYQNNFKGLRVEDKWRKGVSIHTITKPKSKKSS